LAFTALPSRESLLAPFTTQAEAVTFGYAQLGLL
jgi:hypothetical protein